MLQYANTRGDSEVSRDQGSLEFGSQASNADLIVSNRYGLYITWIKISNLIDT